MLVQAADGKVLAINGSGAAPREFGHRLEGAERVPRFGPLSVAVPGIVSAWALALERFGCDLGQGKRAK